MRSFSRKQGTDPLALCEDLYEEVAFGPGSDRDDRWLATARPLFERLCASYPEFSGVDMAVYAAELRALWLEVVAAAWSQVLGDRAAVAQSDFTMGFLVAHGHGDLWERMGAYNRVVSDAATFGPVRPLGPGHPLAVEIAEAHVRLLAEGSARGYAPEATARAVARIATMRGWTAGRLPIRLAVEMARRLGVGDDGCWTPLAAVTERFYREAVGTAENAGRVP